MLRSFSAENQTEKTKLGAREFLRLVCRISLESSTGGSPACSGWLHGGKYSCLSLCSWFKSFAKINPGSLI
jgi:hypothetical protein